MEIVPFSCACAYACVVRVNQALGIQFSTVKKAGLALISSFARHHTAEHCSTITLLDELELQKHLNASLRKVIIRTFKRFLNFRCPTVSDFLRFRFFIQLRLQRAARVMWSLRFARFGRKLPQHPVALI